MRVLDVLALAITFQLGGSRRLSASLGAAIYENVGFQALLGCHRRGWTQH